MYTNAKSVLMVLALFGCLAARAETGVSPSAVRIGQTIGLTGQVSGAVKELNDGANAYLRKVNAEGGVHGRKIELVTLDDRFDPAQAGANALALVKDHQVFALFQSRGTPHTEKILPVLQEFRVPLIAPSTGAAVLHAPVNRYVFNVRTRYQTEIVKAVAQFRLIGIDRIALVHVDDSFGQDALGGFRTAMDEAKLKPAAVIRFNREKPDYVAVVDALIAAAPHTAIVVSSAPTAAAVIGALRERGSRIQVMTLSNNSSQAFVRSLGANAQGVIVTQITPPANVLTTQLGQELQALAKQHGIVASYAAMEGYVAAKVLVEGLRRAGRNLTREGYMQALESIRNHDFGGIAIGYGPTDHTGSEFVEATIIGKDGAFRR
ncbi:MAG TPA: ABC transporter substrate-binding protein [Noviherbaspirillum sp.]|jgi:ABC-type branched-subunit amino acid transport system substrate-binding protein|uniref:ABC transporter substrate-binding protein n=1 Tax=Noviherbaspirillum sp. TaxID=1926288 RepID=UPI002F9393A2